MPDIYVLGQDGNTEVMERIHVKDEGGELQDLLERNYDLLPGDQIDPDNGCRWMLIKREMPVPDPSGGGDRWRIDFLFVDQLAIPTFVECKRFRDTRSRREVIAQMLEYAANAQYYWDKDTLRTYAVESAGKAKSDLDHWLSALELDQPDVDAFFTNVEQNLKAGNIRLIFFLEEAPRELKSLVDFLNKEMEHVYVLLVEARQYQRDGLRVIVPTLFGYTEEARSTKRRAVQAGSARRSWNEEQFLAEASAILPPQQLEAIRGVYEFSKETADRISWGTGAIGSFNPVFQSVCIRSLFGIKVHGALSIPLGWLNGSEAAEHARDEFKRRLEVDLKLSFPAGQQYPNFAPEKWCPHVERFKEIVRQITTRQV